MNALHGVLHSHRLELFVRRFGLDERELEADFSGWHKRVILSPRSAFLFPRYDEDVAHVEREAAALGVLSGVELVPDLLGRHDDEDISPHPFLRTERRRGTSFASVLDDLSLDVIGCVLARLGSATATWHATATDELPEVLRSVPEPTRSSEDFLDRTTLRARLAWARDRLAGALPSDVAPRGSWVVAWEAMLAPLAELSPVLTHGDVHETQILLTEDLEIAAVLDWDHAGVAHPTRDFNFGEWGFEIFAWEDHFDELYGRYWDGYRSAVAHELPDHRSLLLLRTLRDALYFVDRVEASPTWFNAYRLRRNAEHVRDVTSVD